MTYLFTTINDDDVEYSAPLDNREIMQVKFPFKHNNNKTINIHYSHAIVIYNIVTKRSVTNATLSLNSSRVTRSFSIETLF